MTTTKISIDVTDGDGKLIPRDLLNEIMLGCYETLRLLGDQKEMIGAIRVTWVTFGKIGEYGPDFQFYFEKFAGLKCGFGSDFRFLGEGPTKGSTRPTSADIAKYFTRPNCLPEHISEHVARCTSKLEQELGRLPG